MTYHIWRSAGLRTKQSGLDHCVVSVGEVTKTLNSQRAFLHQSVYVVKNLFLLKLDIDSTADFSHQIA